MSANRKTRSKAMRSPSVASSVSLGDEDGYSNRKRMASESNNLGSEQDVVHPSPTKRYKRTVPGTPEYESQPAVVITAQHAYKPLRRKLSFLSDAIDGADTVRTGTEKITIDDEETSAIENVQRSRKLSQKAAYMADTPTRKHKDPVTHNSSVKNRAIKSEVADIPPDTEVVGGTDLSTPKKRPAPRPLKRNTAPAVKAEHVSDTELWSADVSRQSKGKAPARLGSPINVSSDGSGSDGLSDTPQAKGRPSGTIRKNQQLSQASRATAATEDTIEEAVAPPSQLCTLRPTDSSKSSVYAPADLRDPDTDKPIFLQTQDFPVIFKEPMLSSLMASLEFKSLPPFVNPSNFSPSDLTLSDYKNVVWPGSKHNAVCVMFGAVQSCNIIHSTTAGPNKIRALSIIPSSTAFDSFNHFLWKQYDAPELYGPFDYGCLLTFTSRREGLTSSFGSSLPQPSSDRKRNMKLFKSSATAPPATRWFEKNFPPFINYDQDIPIYDASSRAFMFTKDDFAALPSFPRYKKVGDPKNADVPANGLVSVFFGMNTYSSTRVPPTPGSSSRSYQNTDPQTPGSSFHNDKASSQVLSLNLQFVVYHGQVPEPDEDD